MCDGAEAEGSRCWVERTASKVRQHLLRRTSGLVIREYKVFHPRRHCGIAAALGLTLLLACSLACRPAHAARSTPGSRTKPWKNACGSSVPVTNVARHNRHRIAQEPEWPSVDGAQMERKGWSLRHVRGKVRIARAHLRHRRRHIHQVYGQVKVLRKQYTFDWLPQQQIQWYRSEIKCLDRDSQAVHVLPALRSALQNFSATFVELQKTRRWTIDRPGMKNRSLIINELASHVKGMLCEVETAMQERSMPLPPDTLPSEGLVRDPARWDPDPDLTGALIQDWGVVSAYTDALYGWALILRELGHAHKLRRGELSRQVLGCPQRRQHALRRRIRRRRNRRRRRRRQRVRAEAALAEARRRARAWPS